MNLINLLNDIFPPFLLQHFPIFSYETVSENPSKFDFTRESNIWNVFFFFEEFISLFPI